MAFTLLWKYVDNVETSAVQHYVIRIVTDLIRTRFFSSHPQMFLLPFKVMIPHRAFFYALPFLPFHSFCTSCCFVCLHQLTIIPECLTRSQTFRKAILGMPSGEPWDVSRQNRCGLSPGRKETRRESQNYLYNCTAGLGLENKKLGLYGFWWHFFFPVFHEV